MKIEFPLKNNLASALRQHRGVWCMFYKLNNNWRRTSLSEDRQQAEKDMLSFVEQCEADADIEVVYKERRIVGRPKLKPTGKPTFAHPKVAWRKPWVVRDGPRTLRAFETEQEALAYAEQTFGAAAPTQTETQP